MVAPLTGANTLLQLPPPPLGESQPVRECISSLTLTLTPPPPPRELSHQIPGP